MNTLLVITDGRDRCLTRTLNSAVEALPTFDHYVMVNDSLDAVFGEWLGANWPMFDILHPTTKRGFGGAIQAGWDAIPPCDYVFHLEDDFVFNQPVDLDRFVELLELNPALAQVALKRQPWNAEERAAGGIVEQHPFDFEDHELGALHWTEHRRFFTTNPSLYPYELTRRGWPQCEHSEGVFTHQLLEDGLRFAYWGKRFDPPRVHHIGDERVGHGY